jgi:protein-S-isoprenylcysteine O-methyltransferase Ste14
MNDYEPWRWVSMTAVSICWGVVVLTWCVGAAYNGRRAPRVRTRSRVRRAHLLLLAIPTVCVVSAVEPVGYWGPIFTGHVWLAATAATSLLLCTAFTIWARTTLGNMWTSTPSLRNGHVLRTGGPYAVTRHPIYTGVLGMLLNTALISREGWTIVIFVVTAAGLRIKIESEERLLREAFPQRYDKYCGQVPRLIPFKSLIDRVSRRHSGRFQN